MSPRDVVYLGHMLEAAHKISSRAQNLSRATFDADEDRQIVFVHLVQVIGESAARVTQPAREQLPQIPWKQIVGMRNKLVHDYLTIDLDVVWKVATTHIPALIEMLQPVLFGGNDSNSHPHP